MHRRAFSLIAALFLIISTGHSQGIGAYLPAKVAGKATRLLAVIDEWSATIEAGRSAARKAQLKAEADAVEAYALIVASRSSRSSWAKSDGSAVAADAGAIFSAARERGRAAAVILASGANPKADVEGEAAADALSATIVASEIAVKTANGLEKYLAGKSSDIVGLLPELTELSSVLRKAGASGAREAAALMVHRGTEDMARWLVRSKARLSAQSPASAAVLTRLENVIAAQRAWTAVLPIAVYPGDLGSASVEDRAALAAGIAAMMSLGAGRASLLLDAMSAGGNRDVAAAEAASRLAQLWARSPAVRRRDLSSLCGLSEGAMAVFGTVRFPGDGSYLPATASTRSVTPSVAAIAALNGMEIAIADEESFGEGLPPPYAPRGVEPALLLLERPDLAAIAKREPRYAALVAEATRRLAALHAQAAESAQARLEASAAVVKATALALGSTPTDLFVRAIDLDVGREGIGRRIAFFVTATDASGLSISLPLRPETAGVEYATAFAKAAGLGSSKTDPAAILAKYGQWVVCAYDPEGSNSALVIESFPKNGGPARLGEPELELAFLGGWRP